MPPSFPFSVGFRALFERAAFHLQTVFENGPPRSTFIVSDDKAHGQSVSLPPRNPFQAELQRFVDCMRGKADPSLLDAEHAVEALALSLATQRALAEGQSIALGYRPARSSRHKSSRSCMGRSEKENSTASPVASCTTVAQLGTTK